MPVGSMDAGKIRRICAQPGRGANPPSGNASLPDCFFFDRFAIGDVGAAAPNPAQGRESGKLA